MYGFNEGIWNDEDLDATIKMNDECTQDPLQEVICSSGIPSSTSGATDLKITEGDEIEPDTEDWEEEIWTPDQPGNEDCALRPPHPPHPQVLKLLACKIDRCLDPHHRYVPDPVWLASGGKENGPSPVCVQSERWEPMEDGMLFDQVTGEIIQIRPPRAQEFPGGPCKHGGGMTALHYFTPIQPGDATDLMMSKAAGRWFIIAHDNLLWQQVASMVALGIGVPVYERHPRECSCCVCQRALNLRCGIVID
ncbi:uncharacterized protein VTP21DRAFT_3215 [Calcarisporiella thermophila]|uniref:uncharacterized protein n=1 Tax=Calcarisporiella thermophila TaxID=911321 RepID=UPI003743B9AD